MKIKLPIVMTGFINKKITYMNIDKIIEEFTDDVLSEIARKQTHISNGCFGELDYSNGERDGFENGLYFFRDEILKKINDVKTT